MLSMSEIFPKYSETFPEIVKMKFFWVTYLEKNVYKLENIQTRVNKIVVSRNHDIREVEITEVNQVSERDT